MIKWVDASKYWPAMDSRNIIVDGRTRITLKPEYDFLPEHEFAVCLKFYCLIADPLPWSGNGNNDFILDGEIFYNIDDYCCSRFDEQTLKSHKDHQKSIGLHCGNIRKYAEKTQFRASIDLISRWSYIDDETEI